MSNRYPNNRGVTWRSERYGSYPEAWHAAFHHHLCFPSRHHPFIINGYQPDHQFWNFNPHLTEILQEVKHVESTSGFAEFEERCYNATRRHRGLLIFVGNDHRVYIDDNKRCKSATREGFTAAVCEPDPNDEHRCGTLRIVRTWKRNSKGILTPRYSYWDHCRPLESGWQRVPLALLDQLFNQSKRDIQNNPQIEALFPDESIPGLDRYRQLPTIAFRTEPWKGSELEYEFELPPTQLDEKDSS